MSKVTPAVLCASLVSILSVFAGLALFSRPVAFSWTSSWPGPLGPLHLLGDALSAVMLLLVGLVGTAAAYDAARHGQAPRVAVLLPFFLAGLALVPLAGDTFTLITAWELMSVSPGLMIVLDEDAARRRAGLLYLAYSQVSAILLLAGTLLAGPGQTPWQGGALAGGAGVGATLVLFAALVKAGVMPFHAWLPAAHPVAPAHVSALMSGTMVAMPAYLVLRFLAPVGLPGPLAITVILLGGLSAALGSLHALHTRDLKRVLAMTTVAHMGTLFVLLGIGLLLAGRGDTTLTPAVTAAASAYVLAHGLAKGALFLVGGEVHHMTGTTDLDRLGGLVRKAPALGTAAALGGIALAALPPFAGFPAELATLAAVFASLSRVGATTGAILLGVLVLLGVAAGAGLAAIAKAILGVFHGPLRSTDVHPVGPGAAVASGALLVASFAVGVLPGALWHFLTGASMGLLALPTAVGVAAPFGVLAAASALIVLSAAALASRGAVRRADPWNCGNPPPTARQTYSAQGLVMPYRVLFAEILRPGSDLRIQDAPVAQFAPRKGTFVDPAPEFLEPWVHRPLLGFVAPRIEALRRLHRGPVQAYLLVALLVLVAILLLMPVFP